MKKKVEESPREVVGKKKKKKILRNCYILQKSIFRITAILLSSDIRLLELGCNRTSRSDDQLRDQYQSGDSMMPSDYI